MPRHEAQPDTLEMLEEIGVKLDLLVDQVDHWRGESAAGGRAILENCDGHSHCQNIGRLRRIRPALPDARLVRRIIAQRRRRDSHFGDGLFADPAWDMLLDLTAARVEHQRVSVTSLCIASGVPPTTALRWISLMIESGLLERKADHADRRRAFVELTRDAELAMASYFSEARLAAL